LGLIVSALYFISDVHLGLESPAEEEAKELRLQELLRRAASDAEAFYIVGDLFDFWFEYRQVIPATGLRALAGLRDLVDRGVAVHYLAGNHDFAPGPFLSRQVGCRLHAEPFTFEHDGRRFHLHHGDGLAENDLGYRVLRRVLRSPIARRLWRWLHPDLGLGLARRLSRASRGYTGAKDYGSNRRLRDFLARCSEAGDGVILMGHTHEPDVQVLAGGAWYVNLGTWLGGGAPYARYEAGRLEVVRPDGSGIVLPPPAEASGSVSP
jgi:UDP-2,3-diacylglucosamine hydrolase